MEQLDERGSSCWRFQVILVGNPLEEQDAVNLRTLQDSATSVLEQATLQPTQQSATRLQTMQRF